MSTQELSGATALVTGASRGFGRAIAAALSGAGADVVGVARDRAGLTSFTRSSGAPSPRSSPTRPTPSSPASSWISSVPPPAP
jgi:nucleoside-diphosphate-sugar epimerase